MITSLAPLSPHRDLFYTDRWLIMLRARVRFYIYTLENAAGTFLEHKLVVWCSHNPNVVSHGPAMTCSPTIRWPNVFYKTVNWMNCLLREGGPGLYWLPGRVFSLDTRLRRWFSHCRPQTGDHSSGGPGQMTTLHTDNTWSCQACVSAMLTLFLDPSFLKAR